MSSARIALRQKWSRSHLAARLANLPPCLIGMEACATSHHWARELTRLGHAVRLMPPRYVKPYVKRNKNDMADAEAICEAVTRPTMRFVSIKRPDQQSILMLHRTREKMPLLRSPRDSLSRPLRDLTRHLAR